MKPLRIIAALVSIWSCLGADCLLDSPNTYVEAKPTFLEITGPFLVDHDGYTVCYDGRTKNPIWVYEVLTPFGDEREPRTTSFMADPSVPALLQPKNSDYKNTPYDRGHMAAAANHRESKQKLQESFYLTNISPQLGKGFNRQGGIWARLENHARSLLRHADRVHVVSGPLFLPHESNDGERYVQYQVIGKHDVAIPTHFFKILARESNGRVCPFEAYIVPHTCTDNQVAISEFLVPTPLVLQLAGIHVQQLSDHRP